MFLSFESLESLPVIKKLPFSGIEKRILGFVILFSSSIVLFTAITLLLINIKSPNAHEKKTDTKLPTSVTTNEEQPSKEYDPLEQEAILITAEAFLKKGNIEKAGEYLEKLSHINDQSAKQRRITAELLIHQGKLSNAQAYLMELRNEEPNNATTAKLYVKTIAPQTLISTPLETIVKGFSKNPDVLLAVAQTVIKTAPNEAITFLTEALTASPSHDKSLFELGSLYLFNDNVKDIPKAIPLLSKAVMIAPDSAKYSSALGLAEFQMWENSFPQEKKLFNDCEIHLKKAVTLEPNSSNNLYNLAELYSYEDSFSLQSEDLFLKAIKISPTFWNASFKLGLLYLKKRKYEGAINQFNNALALSKDNIRILHQLAVAYEKTGNTVKSQQIYKQIVTINPKDNIALYKLQIIK